MAKKKKRTAKINKVLAAVCAAVLFISGFAGGAYAFHVLNIPTESDPLVSGELEIHFPEMGNKYTGDFTYIKIGDVDILIDGGSKASSIPTLYEYVSSRSSDGVIEYVIVTHAHEDHYAAFATGENTDSLFDLLEVEVIIDFATVSPGKDDSLYKNYLREREEKIAAGARHYTAKELIDGGAATFEIGFGTSFEILDNHYYHTASRNENNNSVCVLLSQGERHFLFTGDLEQDGEKRLVQMNDLPQVELFKAGHHGSNTSSHNELLSVIRPKIVIVTCVAGSSQYNAKPENTYPTQNVINRIAPYTDKVYITSLAVDFANNKYTSFNGNITVTSNSFGTTVTGSRHSLPLKDTEWFRTNRTTPAEWAA